MDIPDQKTIDQYLETRDFDKDKKEKVLAAITHLVYSRNQNVVKAESEKDDSRREQFLRSVEEYDQIIDQKIDAVSGGKDPEVSYDFWLNI